MGSPAPLKMRPTISGASARRMGLPVKRLAVPESVMPLVPANTWMTARSPSNAAMRPRRVPVAVFISTISSKPTPFTPSTATSGPLMSERPKYSIAICKRSFPFSPPQGSALQAAARTYRPAPCCTRRTFPACRWESHTLPLPACRTAPLRPWH